MKAIKRDFWQDGPAHGQAACCGGQALKVGDAVMVHTGNAWRRVTVIRPSGEEKVTAVVSGFTYKHGGQGKPSRRRKSELYHAGRLPGTVREDEVRRLKSNLEQLFAIPGEWYAVVNSVGSVLAVYGSALRDEALASRDKWASMIAVGTNDRIDLMVCKVRPRVGDVLPGGPSFRGQS